MISRLKPWIDDCSFDGGGESYPLFNPWDGSKSLIVEGGGMTAVLQAVTTARSAFEANWRRSSTERSGWLMTAADEVERAQSEIVDACIRCIGKPRRAAIFEAKRTVALLRAVAREVLGVSGEMLPMDSTEAGVGRYGFTKRVPYGVIAAVTPFNAPANLLMQKVAPALVTGNAVIVKPSLEGTAVALILAECFARAGVPKGLLSVIPGGKEEALALAAHDGVALVSLTGSTAAGDALARAAGAKPVLGELGGNSANIVCADAALDDAAKRIAVSAFEASGQQCISAQRIIVETPVLSEFLDLFVAAASAMKCGDPNDPDTDVGPVVNANAADRIMAIVSDAITDGGKVALEPRRKDCVITPGILLDPKRDCRAVQEEIFGPLAVVMPAADVDDAIRIANDTRYGLQASVFTSSLMTAFRMSDELRVGSLWINEGSRFRLDIYPFGGVGRSGFGREGIRYAMEAFTQWKFTGVRLPEAK